LPAVVVVAGGVLIKRRKMKEEMRKKEVSIKKTKARKNNVYCHMSRSTTTTNC
jgi:hypothetical protein